MELTGKSLVGLLPAMMLIACLEALYLSRIRHVDYDWRESFASVAIALLQKLLQLAQAGLGAAILIACWKMRVWTIELNSVWSYALLFLTMEFAYYWHHRISHTSRWFWATHAVHHSPTQFNLSAAYRLGLTGTITGHVLFYAPLALIGFHPAAIGLALAVNLLYQFWLHTELIGRLGWFDRWFNSPSNHRVHHATNLQYLDCNFGGVTMIFDRLFGTYVAEQLDDPPRYGLIKQVNSYNPVRIALHEWVRIAQDLRQARSISEVSGYLFAAPGWQPNGQGATTHNLRKQTQAAITAQR